MFRLSCWLFFLAAIVYAAWLLPRAAAGLIERGAEHPEFWSRLFVTILVGSGVVIGVIAMVHVTKAELMALLDCVQKNKRVEAAGRPSRRGPAAKS